MMIEWAVKDKNFNEERWVLYCYLLGLGIAWAYLGTFFLNVVITQNVEVENNTKLGFFSKLSSNDFDDVKPLRTQAKHPCLHLCKITGL